ncbi:hypothetical protein ACHHRT_04450 [Desulfurivibrio sp. D14AmB]|uniref:hypothetical protein n=1 Tax=Desulfurivibrio sp. D14AmB TaxID=3374370 RepID=UPI00376EED84
MLSANTQAHSLMVRYYEQNINWSRSTQSTGKGSGTVAGGTELFSLTTKALEFRLEVRQAGASQTGTQAAVASRLADMLAEHGIDPDQFSHQGRSILELSPGEAQALVAEDGYWGINQTSTRLAEFVLKGAGDNLEMLRAGREGVLRGFKEAEKIWGGGLPEISHQTLERALAAIDDRIRQLGGTVIDRSA